MFLSLSLLKPIGRTWPMSMLTPGKVTVRITPWPGLLAIFKGGSNAVNVRYKKYLRDSKYKFKAPVHF